MLAHRRSVLEAVPGTAADDPHVVVDVEVLAVEAEDPGGDDVVDPGRLNLDGFVSETIGIDDVEEAFHKMERGEVLRSVVVI